MEKELSAETLIDNIPKMPPPSNNFEFTVTTICVTIVLIYIVNRVFSFLNSKNKPVKDSGSQSESDEKKRFQLLEAQNAAKADSAAQAQNHELLKELLKTHEEKMVLMAAILKNYDKMVGKYDVMFDELYTIARNSAHLLGKLEGKLLD